MITLLVFLLFGIYAANFTTHRLPSLGACFAIGMALYVLIGTVYTMAIAEGYPFHAASWLLACSMVIHWFLLRDRFLPLRQRVPRLQTRPEKRYVAFVLMLAVIFAVAALFRFVGVPPANYDVLSYHIPLAQKFVFPAAANELFWKPQIFYARMPLGGPLLEAPFVRGQFVGSLGIGIHLFLFATILAGAACCARIAAWFGARMAGRLVAALLYLLHPMVAGSLAGGLLDPATALLAVAAVELILSGCSRQGSFLTVLTAGLVLGTAFSLKMSAAGIAVIPIALYGVWCFFASRAVDGAKGIFVYTAALGVGIIASIFFWLVRAFVIGGHIMHPFKGAVAGWTEEQGRFVVESHNPLGPLQAEYWASALRKIGVWGYEAPFISGSSMLLVCAFGAAAFYISRRALPLVAAALLGYLAWLGIDNSPQRFLLSAVMLLVVPAALLIDAALRRHWAIGVAFLAVFAFPAYRQVSDAYSFEPYYTASARDESLNYYLGDENGQSPLMKVVREARPEAEKGRLLLFFEARPTLFVGSADYRTVWDQPLWAEDLKSSESPGQFLQKLRESGYTAIFVNESEWGRLLQFYAKDQLPSDFEPWGSIGIFSEMDEELRMEGLKAFPPHRFAGLAERDLTILRDFLLACRQRTYTAEHAGKGAEIWYARLPESFLHR